MIYNNISLSDFLELSEKLKPLKLQLNEILKAKAVVKITETYYADFLGIDLHFYDGQDFHYNLGVVFDDNPEHTFTVMVTKSIDVSSKRYFKRLDIIKNVKIPAIEESLILISGSIDMVLGWEFELLKRVDPTPGGR